MRMPSKQYLAYTRVDEQDWNPCEFDWGIIFANNEKEALAKYINVNQQDIAAVGGVRVDDGSVGGYARFELPRESSHQRWDGDEEPLINEVMMKEEEN